MKKCMTRLALSLWLLAGLLLPALAAAEAKPPPPPAYGIYVQDYANVLTAATKNRISNIGAQIDARSKAQLVVVTVKSLGGASVEEYSLTLLRQWGIGNRSLNNGLLILVSVGDRQSRVEVGYGLEGALPDAKTGRIQDEYMIPYFRQGDYDQGVLNGYLAFAGEVAKEYKFELKADGGAKAAPRTYAPAQKSWWDALPWWAQGLLIAGLIGLLILDWLFFGGQITYLLISLFFRRGGGGGGGGFGGGGGGGGGSSRRW